MKNKTLSPLDNRYADKVAAISSIFNESEYYKRLCLFELDWYEFIILKLSALKKMKFDMAEYDLIDAIREEIKSNGWDNRWDMHLFKEIKEIEAKTKHDIKAVEYFLSEYSVGKRKLRHKRLLHFGLTSQDVVSCVYNRMVHEAFHGIPYGIRNALRSVAFDLFRPAHVKFIGRTHGQKAVITTFAEQFQIQAKRVEQIASNIDKIKFTAKLGGALGDFGGLKKATGLNTNTWAAEFMGKYLDVEKAEPSIACTQTDYHIYITQMSHQLHHLCHVMIDICKDIWMYCSLGHMYMKSTKDQVGSSTMSQKSNPIQFENCEGNMQIAAKWFELFFTKFPESRMQRDLSDSTVIRNVGVALGHFYLGLTQLLDGLANLEINKEFCEKEVEQNYQVHAEFVQLTLKMEGQEDAYEKVKQLFRVQNMSKRQYLNVIRKLGVNKKTLTKLSKV